LFCFGDGSAVVDPEDNPAGRGEEIVVGAEMIEKFKNSGDTKELCTS
jgi:hypothetical protein